MVVYSHDLHSKESWIELDDDGQLLLVLVNFHGVPWLFELPLVLPPVPHRRHAAIVRVAPDRQFFERIEEQLPLGLHRSMAHPKESNR